MSPNIEAEAVQGFDVGSTGLRRRTLRTVTGSLAPGAVRLDAGVDRGEAAMRRTGADTVDAEAWRPWRTYAMHHFRYAADRSRTPQRDVRIPPATSTAAHQGERCDEK
ncbi:hypothetical protein ACFU53_26755 [Streptomyces sp. NPDC057474]|uniref:hypothetical protein n=1 Tax=Streptomyces sp. NPDC057474 TaxID=3346144 RepID=UPI00369B736B